MDHRERNEKAIIRQRAYQLRVKVTNKEKHINQVLMNWNA